MADFDELAICPGGPQGRGWLPAGPYRHHLRELMLATGLPWRAVALYGGLPARFAARLAGGRPPRRVPFVIAARLMAVGVDELAALAETPGRRRLTSRRVQWLVELGLSPDSIAELVGVSRTEVDRLARDRGWCSARTELLARAAVQAYAGRYPHLVAPEAAA